MVNALLQDHDITTHYHEKKSKDFGARELPQTFWSVKVYALHISGMSDKGKFTHEISLMNGTSRIKNGMLMRNI